jgi:hypothetical protein
LNGNIFNPEVQSIANCVECYRNALRGAELYGPTNFGSLLNNVNEFCTGKSGEES